MLNLSFCKGTADYYHLNIDREKTENSVWRYIKPPIDFLPIKEYIAFYENAYDKVEIF